MTNIVRPHSGETETAISVGSLVKTYGEDVTALDGLDLEVDRAIIFGLLGPNGAGKTTAVKILTTLSRPDEGTAEISGIDVLAHPERIRRIVGSVAQRSGADVHATGTENLTLQARVFGLDRSQAHSRAEHLLERFGLAEASNRLVKTWSGGMRRRLDVALALVHSPTVLFLDEPTTGLDPEIRSELWNVIRDLRDQHGATIMLTTHYLDEADQLADRLAILDRGKVVAEGTPSDLKDAMRGDGVHVELTSPEMAAMAIKVLNGDAGISDPLVDGRSVHVRAEHGAVAVPRVLGALSAAGIEVSAVTVNRPSLDDVFLRHTGHKFTESEPEVSS